MKSVLTKFLAFGSAALLMLSACKKELAPNVTSNGGKAGTLNASVTTLPLDKTMLTDTTTVIRFSFSKANYGFSAAVTNTLQIDVPGDNWKNPTSATLGTGVYSQGYSTSAFNSLVLKLNVAAGVATPIVVRVQHVVSAGVAPIYTNTLSLTVTAFNLTSYVYVTGAFSGWANPGAGEDSLVSVTGNGVYVGVINFNATGSGANQFLILPAKNWNNKYATSGSSTPSTTVTYNASNNLNAPTANGQYIVTFNLNTGTITFALTDYYSIIGSATPGGNWSTDLFLKYVNDGNGNWVGNFTLLAGQFKVRQDAAWSNSWGTSSTAGILTDASGGNINNVAGSATITFTMAPTPFGSSAVATAPYTLTQ
jgi:hypothetical protein